MMAGKVYRVYMYFEFYVHKIKVVHIEISKRRRWKAVAYCRGRRLKAEGWRLFLGHVTNLASMDLSSVGVVDKVS